MKNKIPALATLSLLIMMASAFACMSVTNRFSVSDSTGDKNVTFNEKSFKESIQHGNYTKIEPSPEHPNLSFSYPSHYDNKAKTTLSVSFKNDHTSKEVFIIIDIPYKQLPGHTGLQADYSLIFPEQKNFDFRKAIKTELQWLINNNILQGLNTEDIETINDIIKGGGYKVDYSDDVFSHNKKKHPTWHLYQDLEKC